MKLLHLSDLHIGKRLNEFSLIEDQRFILNQICDIVKENAPDAVLIAGDVYDKSVPSAEAVSLFDEFLVNLSRLNTRIMVISGNHDSPERIAFGSRLMEASGVYMCPVYSAESRSVTLADEYGECDIYMLPFVKPANVRRFFPDEEIESYTDAIRLAVNNMNIDTEKRNVLIAHQYVTGAERSESEELSVGGLDNVDVSVFLDFDYVALGHIHGPQNCADNVRYCGTPLKYSFSEVEHKKSATLVTLGKKGDISLDTIPLSPMREMYRLYGSFDELLGKGRDDDALREAFVQITLTDEDEVPDALAILRAFYHNIMELRYDNTRTRNIGKEVGAVDVKNRSPLELVGEFYSYRNGREMSEEESTIVRSLIEEIWEDGE